ncbi:MAG: hypothetical protein GIW99_11050, partial [Candidatus Eremiobacteraeota bacterium]|nr:hypothetical protein [Candidatus Eremiobacteraeota bacterium]
VDTRVLDVQAAAAQTVPFFRSTVKSPLDGQTYPFEMVGSNPITQRRSTTVKYLPLLLRFHFPDGTVLDPSKAGCNDYYSVADRFFGSPLFETRGLVVKRYVRGQHAVRRCVSARELLEVCARF